ncbi:MAG TPA: aldo/keto reductase [Rhodocyclaceae bacterium]|nr:aldo/keto reductase [Rhodocyclaceae bacterium]
MPEPILSGAPMTRAQFLRLAAAAAASLAMGPKGLGAAPDAPGLMATRPIPASGERLPVIGCGTHVGFDVSRDADTYRRLTGVLQALFEAGGTVIDSSPMYGRAEAVVGELLAAAPPAWQPFLATKVWTRGRAAGIAQMEASRQLLGTERIDLMQVHNLVDWRTHLATLREWKAQGRIRYVGITHYTSRAYDEVEAVMRAGPLDFLQINYSLDEREAERRLLPLAAERGVAVVVNRPFGGGRLLQRLRDRPLPAWAADIGAASWAQLLLKFVLAHPAVTCAIPGTGRPEHMADNAGAGVGPLPDPAFWARHAASIER